MHLRRTFEDDGFVYELTVESSARGVRHIYTTSQPEGYRCEWVIKGKKSPQVEKLAVTDDDCEIVVYTSLDAAVAGAKQFLSL
jgi:hypothetical protein